ncbi:MAG: aspartate kinase [Candidatus Methanomethylophilaceae archaeon]|nr:aspartate kinase [Candidatus Methanomethylophilaceae archaeon]
MITVMKFGGTSVGSAEAIERVANIIVNTEGEKVVVASAMSGITNFLVQSVDSPTMNVDEVVKQFADKHIMAAEQMFDEKTMADFMVEFNSRLAFFKEAISSDPNDAYYKDLVTSQGERFSTLMLSYYLRKMGYESVALTAETAGIAAVGLPLSGSADLQATASGMTMKVRPLLSKGIIPIITGFYGIKDGAPLTFGRGGSDYSAAVVANALDADMLEIWTDVDGFMTADPRIIKNAIKIEEMTFGEAAELAYFGAKVLHPRTIEPVRIKRIPLKVRNSFRPQEPGTLIHSLRKKGKGLLKSVATKNDLAILTISSAEIAYRPELAASIINEIAQDNVIIYSISTSLSTIAVLIDNKEVAGVIESLNNMSGNDIERIDVKNNVSLVCCVGDDLLSKCGVTGEIFTAVKEAGVNVEMISEGASEVSLNFVVPMGMVMDVVAVLHAKYIG